MVKGQKLYAFWVKWYDLSGFFSNPLGQKANMYQANYLYRKEKGQVILCTKKESTKGKIYVAQTKGVT